ncbi:MAG: hypothetical protein ACE5GI_00075 [Candidatus Aminicenantales bacterium]
MEKAIQTALARPNYKVISFSDAQGLLPRINSVSADIILLRLAFPAEKSCDISRFLKSKPQFKDVPLVLLQGLFEPLVEETGVEASFDEVVKLPFASAWLAELIMALVNKKRFPLTLPEETEIGARPPTDSDSELEDKIRAIVSQEVVAMERELEKRLKAQLLPEIKSWVKRQGLQQKRKK